MAKTGKERFEEMRQRLKRKQHPTKKSIEEMDLPELREMERKFLAWYPTTKHPDKEVKKHIYEHYIKPRIEFLQGIETHLLGETPPAGSQIPLDQGGTLVSSTNN